MSSRSEQNGRQPSVNTTAPVRFAALTDPRIRNAPPSDSRVEVCRNYVWGICNKHGQCKFRHESTLEEMRTIINFCHDFQNRTGCTLPNCTYLHASKEEENLFREKGQLPQVLMERHIAMNAAAAASSNAMPSMDVVPPTLYVTPPPVVTAPPPPPPPPPLQSRHTLMPPPPPPPPTEPSVVVPGTHPLYTASPTHSLPGLNQAHPPLPPMFDASRPPPNIRNGALKRTYADLCEAGPSKLRKVDNIVADSMCEKCIQREISSDLCSKEYEKLKRENEYKKILYASKVEEIDTMTSLMKFTLPSELRLTVEEDIDGGQSPSLGLSVPMQLLMRLFDDRITSSSSNVMDSIQSSSMKELVISYLLNSSSSPERSSRSDDSTSSLQTFLNGHTRTHQTAPSTSNNNRSPSFTSIRSNTPRVFNGLGPLTTNSLPVMTAAPSYPAYQPSVPPPMTTPMTAPVTPPVLSLAYPAYQPTAPPPSYQPPYAPPPARAAYAPPFTTAGSPAPGAFPTAARTAAAPPTAPPYSSADGHSYPYSMAPGYASHHYYPPFQ